LILLQPGKGSGMGAIGGSGAGGTVFGASGAVSFMQKLTAWLGAGFMVFSITLAAMSIEGSNIRDKVKDGAKPGMTAPKDDAKKKDGADKKADETKDPKSKADDNKAGTAKPKVEGKKDAAPAKPKVKSTTYKPAKKGTK
jgi:preprotein translocase subunit SecG